MGRGNNSSRGIATRPRNSARSGQFCWPLPSHSSFFFFFIFQSRDRGYISLTYTYPIPGRDSLRKSQLIMANLPHPHLSPRGSLLLSDIVINRGIIPKTAHLALACPLSHCTPRAVNFSAAHSGRRERCPVGRGIYVGEWNRQRYGYTLGEWWRVLQDGWER